MLKLHSIVKFRDGYYEISALYKNTANLRTIFSQKIAHKKIPRRELIEAYDEWYEKWSQSESYQCM